MAKRRRRRVRKIRPLLTPIQVGIMVLFLIIMILAIILTERENIYISLGIRNATNATNTTQKGKLTTTVVSKGFSTHKVNHPLILDFHH
jgi:biopolymer transport protein ExbD